jgi:hypothetical protein
VGNSCDAKGKEAQSRSAGREGGGWQTRTQATTASSQAVQAGAARKCGLRVGVQASTTSSQAIQDGAGGDQDRRPPAARAEELVARAGETQR